MNTDLNSLSGSGVRAFGSRLRDIKKRIEKYRGRNHLLTLSPLMISEFDPRNGDTRKLPKADDLSVPDLLSCTTPWFRVLSCNPPYADLTRYQELKESLVVYTYKRKASSPDEDQ